MKPTEDDREPQKEKRNRRIAILCLSFVAGMVGLAYASVPLYDLFCRVTGYGGTPNIAESMEGIKTLDRMITVRFDANVAPGLAWAFSPAQKEVRLPIGAMGEMTYHAKNLSSFPLIGTATFNVTPEAAGAYFSKIACFCFTEQKLDPGEEAALGVTFYVDPAIVEDADTAGLGTITLSYSFFKAASENSMVSALPAPPDPL